VVARRSCNPAKKHRRRAVMEKLRPARTGHEPGGTEKVDAGRACSAGQIGGLKKEFRQGPLIKGARDSGDPCKDNPGRGGRE